MINKEQKEQKLSIALSELKNYYSFEQNRFSRIENKTLFFLTLNGIFLTIASTFLFDSVIHMLLIIPILISVVSIYFGIKSLQLRFGSRPYRCLIKEKNFSFYDFVKYDSTYSIYDELVISYEDSIKKEIIVNNNKMKNLVWCINFTKFTFISFIIIILLVFVFVLLNLIF